MRRLTPLAIVLLFLHFRVSGQTFFQVGTFAGTTAPGMTNGPVGSATFNSLYSLCCDFATGDMYVADAGNNSIRKISNGTVTTLAGNGSIGDVDGQGSNASFYGTSGLCFANGYVYVSDNGNNKIRKIDAAGNVTTVAGSGLPGYQDGPVLQAKFYNPTDVKVVPNGDVYVADYGNNCIRLISNGQVTTVAGVGGQAGDQLGAALTAKFNRPSSICIDPSGHIYVADQVNNKVKVIYGGTVSLVAGSGAPGNVNGTGAAAQFDHPSYVDFDLYGNLLVSEWINNDIRRCTPAGVVSSIAGSGTAGYFDGPVASAMFHSPYGICVDAAGTIYVGDKLNNVVRKLTKGDLSVNEHSPIAGTLSLFPNPASGKITVVNPGTAGALTQFRLFSSEGKLLRNVDIEKSEERMTLDLTELPEGIYLLIAITSEDKVYSSRLVVDESR